MGGVGVSFDDPDTVEHQLRYESRPSSSASSAHSGSGSGGGVGGDGREDTTTSPPVPREDVGGSTGAGPAVSHSPGRHVNDIGSSDGDGDGHPGPATAGGGRGLDHECGAAHANGHVDADDGGGGCGEGGSNEMDGAKPTSASGQGAAVPRAQTIEVRDRFWRSGSAVFRWRICCMRGWGEETDGSVVDAIHMLTVFLDSAYGWLWFVVRARQRRRRRGRRRTKRRESDRTEIR